MGRESEDALRAILSALERNDSRRALEITRKQIEKYEEESSVTVIQNPVDTYRRLKLTVFGTLKGVAISACASTIGATAVYPIDLVKTRMQNQRKIPGTALRYNNSFDCFVKVLRNEGFFRLYSGLIPNLLGQVPEKAMRLFVVEEVRKRVLQWGNKEDKGTWIMAEGVAGFVAGTCQVMITNPAEIVKVRLQVAGESGAHQGIISTLRSLGLGGMYRGASACFLRDIPFSTLYFPVYWMTKDALKTHPTQLLGMISSSLTTPADVIKTRLQTTTPPGVEPYRGFTDCLIRVLKQEGGRALFKGIGPRVFRSSPQYGVMLLGYEFLLRLFPSEGDVREHIRLDQLDRMLGSTLEDRWMATDVWEPPASFVTGVEKFRKICVGGQGNAWGLTKDKRVMAWTGHQWAPVKRARLDYISVGADGAVWGVDDEHVVRWDPWNMEFRPIRNSPKMKKISVGNANKVWGLGIDHQVYKYGGNFKWKKRGSLLMGHVSVGADGTVWAIDLEGTSYHWQSLENDWRKVPTEKIRFTQISVGGASNVWATGKNEEGKELTLKWNGEHWESTNKELRNVATSADGTVIGLSTKVKY